MTEREKHIEMAQRLGLVGMRPHLDGIYIDALAAFAKLVADDARATPALPQGDEYKHAKCPGHDAYAASQALPQGVEEWIANAQVQLGDESPAGWGNYIPSSEARAYLSGMAIVPVTPTLKMIEAAIYHAMRETDEDKYRAIGMIRCVWDEMLAAAKEKGE